MYSGNWLKDYEEIDEDGLITIKYMHSNDNNKWRCDMIDYTKFTANYDISFMKNVYKNIFTPKKIIFNFPATIVFWQDGTKTVVKCSDDDTFDIYDAFTAALAKKIFGHTSTVKNIIKKKSNLDHLIDENKEAIWSNISASDLRHMIYGNISRNDNETK